MHTHTYTCIHMHTFLWETNLKVKQKYNQCGVENLVDSISEIRKELSITRCDCVLLSWGMWGRLHAPQESKSS